MCLTDWPWGLFKHRALHSSCYTGSWDSWGSIGSRDNEPLWTSWKPLRSFPTGLGLINPGWVICKILSEDKTWKPKWCKAFRLWHFHVARWGVLHNRKTRWEPSYCVLAEERRFSSKILHNTAQALLSQHQQSLSRPRLKHTKAMTSPIPSTRPRGQRATQRLVQPTLSPTSTTTVPF